jgi:hypothetical protein
MVKLSRACYAVRSLRLFISHESLRMIYFSYFHTVMSYGIIFWGNTLYSNNIFKLQKRVIRIITNSRNRDSCRELFKELNILFYSQYLFSLLTSVIDNMSLFKLILTYITLIPEVKMISTFCNQGCLFIVMMFIIWV